MTAETDLLPLPEGEAIGWTQAWSYDQMRDYARANMEPLQAEIEALRAEVAEWKRVAAARGEAEARAERLAEALRELVEVFSESGMYDEEVFDKARAALALEQEAGRG